MTIRSITSRAYARSSRSMSIALCAIAMVAPWCACAAIGQITPDSEYAIINRTNLHAKSGFDANSINNAGNMGGSDESSAAILLDSGIIIKLPYLPDHNSGYVLDINESNETTGINSGTLTPQHGVFWDAQGHAVDVGTLGGTWSKAYAINNLGQVVGVSEYAGPNIQRAYLWENGVMTDLGTLPGTGDSRVAATGINDSTKIVGYVDGAQLLRAFIWEDGAMRDLGGPVHLFTEAHDINQRDFIVGGASDDADALGKETVVWTPDGEMIVLQRLPGGGRTNRFVISDDNVVLASDIRETTPPRAIVWPDLESVPFLLRRLLPLRSGWIPRGVQDINDHNQIVGYGDFLGVKWQDFLLTPVHPTLNLSQVSPGIAGEVNSIKASNIAPGATVYIYVDGRGGGKPIPGCSIQENVMQIGHHTLVGIATADTNGEATVTGYVPAKASGRPLLFQAVVPDSCEISNLVDQTLD
jgi:probable HAF family extracellular repeat protein